MQRVVGAWNALPEEVVVEAGTLATFKRHLDGYMNGEGIEGYGPSKGRTFFKFSWDSMIATGLEDRRACSCAVIFFVLCSLYMGAQVQGERGKV